MIVSFAKVPNIISSILLLGIFAYSFTPNMPNKIHYVALGDSYTICEGAKWEESWPYIMSDKLNKAGVPIILISNPSRTGWTTQDLIDNELPIFDMAEANFATLLIGVNDWVQGVSAEQFHKNLNFIIDHVLAKINGPVKEQTSRLVLITIPDFSVTPEGSKYSGGRNISEGLAVFNQAIIQEAKKRNLACVDIFPISKEMKEDPELISKDHLHPSAKEYALWEKLIYPAVYDALKRPGR